MWSTITGSRQVKYNKGRRETFVWTGRQIVNDFYESSLVENSQIKGKREKNKGKTHMAVNILLDCVSQPTVILSLVVSDVWLDT